MNEYNLKNGNYPDTEDSFIGSESLSPDEKSRILEHILEKPETQKGRTRSPLMKTRKLGVFVAAAALILAMASISFAAIALNVDFLSFFHPANQKDIDVLNAHGTLIDKQVTENGLTVDIREAIGDKNSVNIFFDIIAPEGMALDQSQYTFLQNYVQIDSPFHTGAGYHFTELEDSDLTDNKRSVILSLDTDGKLPGKTLSLSFQDFCVYKTEEEIAKIADLPERTEPGTPGDEYDVQKILVPGNWEISFPLDYTDNSITWNPKVEIPAKNGPLKIHEVCLSPLSISFTLKGPWQDGPDTEESYYENLAVQLKDGSTALISSGGSSNDGFGHLSLRYQFQQLIYPEDIESITLFGVKIPLDF